MDLKCCSAGVVGGARRKFQLPLSCFVWLLEKAPGNRPAPRALMESLHTVWSSLCECKRLSSTRLLHSPCWPCRTSSGLRCPRVNFNNGCPQPSVNTMRAQHPTPLHISISIHPSIQHIRNTTTHITNWHCNCCNCRCLGITMMTADALPQGFLGSPGAPFGISSWRWRSQLCSVCTYVRMCK